YVACERPGTTKVVSLSLHDALPIFDLKADVLMSVCLYLIGGRNKVLCEFYLKIWTMCHRFVFILCFLCGKRFRILLKLPCKGNTDRKSTRLNSSHVSISYAVFCLKK